ncbi:MAG: hypothetical protein AAFU78_22890 [Cyanobacteria bacterium J06633_2]
MNNWGDRRALLPPAGWTLYHALPVTQLQKSVLSPLSDLAMRTSVGINHMVRGAMSGTQANWYGTSLQVLRRWITPYERGLPLMAIAFIFYLKTSEQ